MDSNSSSTRPVVGLAALSVALVIIRLAISRRKEVRGASGASQDGMRAEAGIGNEKHSPGMEFPGGLEVRTNKRSNASEGKFLLEFFFLAFALAVPFWLFGGGKLPLPINLPVGALVTFVPMIAASIVSYRQYGFGGVRVLFKKALDYKKIRNRIWYLPTLLLMPLIYLLSFAAMRLAGLPLPEPIQVPFLLVPLFFVMFFIGGVGEELGWMGYAVDPMQNRWGALKASLILGTVWALWHFIPYVQTENTPDWLLWQSLSAVALRILIVWVYNNTGKSVFAAILFHDMVNLSWSLFPNYGSHFDPLVTGLITWITIVIVMSVWNQEH